MYYGMDVHKDEIQICKLISDDTDSYEQTRITNSEENLIFFAKGLHETDQVVFEASFNSWRVNSILRQYSKAKIKVANAHKVRLIGESRIKTDKIDALILAKLLRAKFIPEVELPSEYAWELRQLSYHRRFLVKQRTAFKNTIQAILNKNLIKCPYSSVFTTKGRLWLRSLKLGSIEILMIDNSITILESVELAIKQVDEEILKTAKKDESIQLLISIPGVDLTCALGILATIDDIDRFDSPEKLSSYFGLVPSVSQSGNKCYHGKITKTGNKNGRWLVIEAAQAMALSGCPLAATYYRIKAHKGHNKAIVALGRKMIELVWHMLKKKEPYRYAPSARTREKLRKLDPKTPAIDRAVVSKIDINQIYKEFKVNLPSEASSGEKRAAAKNRRTITMAKKTS